MMTRASAGYPAAAISTILGYASIMDGFLCFSKSGPGCTMLVVQLPAAQAKLVVGHHCTWNYRNGIVYIAYMTFQSFAGVEGRGRLCCHANGQDESGQRDDKEAGWPS